MSERRIYFLCHFACIRPVSKKNFPWLCHVLCEHYLTKLVIFWCPEQELWLFKQSYCNSLGNNAPSSPNDVFIFYVISLVYVLSQKKLFLGLATSFASITWPSSLFSDAQNRNYGGLNKVTAIRWVITHLPLRTTYLFSMSFPLYTSCLKKTFSLALPRPLRALPDQDRYFLKPRKGDMAV